MHTSKIKEISIIASDAEEKVKKFYDTIGWQTEGKITEYARKSEDLRENAKQYVSKCRLRVLRYIRIMAKIYSIWDQDRYNTKSI